MQSLSKKQLITYALIAMPLSIVGLPLYIYLPTFYATEVGVNIAVVGMVLFIARLSDVITDPLIGYLSDLSVKYFENRKPLMFLGAFILIISFYFLLNPNINYPISWLLFFSIFIYLGWSMINIPYLTFSSELSEEYYVKTKLNSFRELATILGLVLALVVPYFFEVDLIQEKLQILFLLFAVLFIPFFLITMKSLKVLSQKEDSSFSLSELKNIYKTIPNLKSLQLGYFLNNLANAIPATLFLLFIEIVISNKEYSDEILILYFVSGVIALPFWTLLSKKIGKKKVWVLSIVLASVSFLFVVFLKEGDILAFAIISLISGLSLGADITFPTSIQADIVQRQKRFSGLLFGIWSMLTKLALAFSVVVTFGILGIVGFDKENLNETSILTLTLLYGFLPIVLKMFALFFINKFNEGHRNL